MTNDALADRFVSYSDAIVAFSLVNSLAFLIALTERDVRCSLVGISGAVWICVGAFPLLLTLGLVACRRAEVRLRRASHTDAAASAYQALGYLHIVRIGMLWLGIILCVPLIRMALSDTTCGTSAA